jgi:ribokinase
VPRSCGPERRFGLTVLLGGKCGGKCVTLAPVRSSRPRVAVVGHVEWVQFARVASVPLAGQVAHARDSFEEPAGGGAVAAVQLARLAGAALFVTALGEDEHGRRSAARLSELGVDTRASYDAAPTRRALTLVDDAGERTITTFGERLEPLEDEDDALWDGLGRFDALYFTAGGLGALRAARAASDVLVVSPRARYALGHGVALDALVLSGEDQIELSAAAGVEADAKLVVWTAGERGGRYRSASSSGTWQAGDLPGPAVDSYGCGDSFAAGFTYALGAGYALEDALALAARCGATCLTGHGPYERQLRAADL